MYIIQDVITANGSLDKRKLWKTEILHRGNNGQHVERIYLSPSESYIFKPLTNSGQKGKEIWVYEHVLRYLPPFYPKIIMHSGANSPAGWIILEDLGNLVTTQQENAVWKAVECMVIWHQFPAGKIQNASLNGEKPPIDVITQAVLQKENTYRHFLSQLHFTENEAKTIADQMNKAEFAFPAVFSHGDLHQGNYAFDSTMEFKVIDWEHAHINVPFWDLYHLIDITHPFYEKTISPEWREQVLEYYVSKMGHYLGGMKQHAFKQAYYLFAVIFSIWMLLLIDCDLKDAEKKWPADKLRRQFNETAVILRQCAEKLLQTDTA